MRLLNTHLSVFAFGWDVYGYFLRGCRAGASPCVCSLHEVAENQAVYTTGIHADTKNVLHHSSSSGVNRLMLALVQLCYGVFHKAYKFWVQIGWLKQNKRGRYNKFNNFIKTFEVVQEFFGHDEKCEEEETRSAISKQHQTLKQALRYCRRHSDR